MERKRIVVKIGSSSLTNQKGEIDFEKFNDHIEALAQLKLAGHEVLLVSSGAVAAGFRRLGYPSRPVTMKGKQAAAAVGQSLLIQLYNEAFLNYNIVSAQVLLTRTDFSEKERYQNAYATFSELLERSVLPIINENDTISVAELTFGDNDMLSALVAGLVHADELIILTDVNGLYTMNPMTNPDAQRFDFLTSIPDELLSMTAGSSSKLGTGGMESKLLAARYAIEAGCHVFIGKGTGAEKLLQILANNGDGTYIAGEKSTTLSNRRQWLRLSTVTGKIFIDEGAVKALTADGKSLLPAGIYALEGHFKQGDVVEVFYQHHCVGRGEINYGKEELMQAMGKHSTELKQPSEVIHRNNWVQMKEV
ncbi:glutamate 5-kinase [Metasolibacillus meyeri]|uniref:glutamate 5-kinase n=1 Tax=Metasolibacillus meyeri TaxID=1071052 RepID=UPI000D3247F7|nr:glutamate 5-kinase [Metasolibacillus meyeri]